MTTSEQPRRSALARYDLSWDAPLKQLYSLNWEALIYLGLFILAVITRFAELGVRVMSHDESLHTYYSWRLMDSGDFQHTPLMHGPLLFHVTAFFYFLFGDNDFTARIYTAGLGVLIVMFPFLFRRWLGRTGAIIAAGLLLISPMMMYYSRYIRHDIPNIFYWLVMVYALLQYLDGAKPRQPIWLLVFSGGLVLGFASKETQFIYLAILISFMAFYWVLRMMQGFTVPRANDQVRTWGAPITGKVIGHLSIWVSAFLIGFFGLYLLWYWQFAEMSLIWVGVAAAALVLLRLIPLIWQLTLQAFAPQSGVNDLFRVLAAFGMLLGVILILFGALGYQTNDSAVDQIFTDQALRVRAGQLGAVTPATNINADELSNYEAARRTGGLVAMGGVALLLLTGGLFLILNLGGRSPESEDETPLITNFNGIGWLLNTLLMAGVVALFMWGIWGASRLSWDEPTRGAQLLLTLGLTLLLGLSMESVGLVRSLVARAPRRGMADMFTLGFSQGKSASLMIIAGTVIGTLLAVYAFGVLDIIKPAQVWCSVPNQADVVVDRACQIIAGRENITDQTPYQTVLNFRLANNLLLWLIVPIIGAVVLVLIVALLNTPARVPLPWAEIFSILLAALLVGSILVFVERHSLETKEEVDDTAVAIDPNAPVAANGRSHKDYIIGLTVVGLLAASGAVVLWRMFWPRSWEFLKRQPSFDVLLVTFTLVLPWIIALPIFMAGYKLDVIPPPGDTLGVMILVTGACWILCATIGFAWNPRVWLLAVVVFMALFVFFFTTVFTNGVGVFTGMVNSLGYWLEQQGVRRGSQPQYYYTLIQIPFYEFLPAILAGLAGLAGLGGIFQWRARQYEQVQAQNPSVKADTQIMSIEELAELEAAAQTGDAEAVYHVMSKRSSQPLPTLKRDWARPYDEAEEQQMRQHDPEWLGGFPFLQFVGFWAVIMITGLTIAGEKMPWLTTHISVPLALAGGWYTGRMIERISWQAVRRGGWLLMLGLIPVLIVSFLRLISPLAGAEAPFQGQAQNQLSTTYAWVAAVGVFLATGYFIYRLGAQISWGQTRRLAFMGLTLVLAFLTFRAAFMANFQNYDLATEYLVYAHAGPAISIVLDEINYIAERTNEGDKLRVAYDDDSSWPMTWYMRHYNTAFFGGTAEDIERNPAALEGAAVVVVGGRKMEAVGNILGDRYYRFDYVRLWWPMQEYFHLNYDRVANVFQNSAISDRYRQGMWDIWWDRDYTAYGQAQCFESRARPCENEADRNACYARVENECRSDDRYALNRWPVSDRMAFYVDKEIAARIWDAGIGGETVAVREPQNILDALYRELEPLAVFGIGELNRPRGLDVGADGLIYVADTENSRLMVYSAEGEFIRSIGVARTGDEILPGELFQPWGVAVAPNGDVYVADTWNHRVQVYDANGEPKANWGNYGLPEDGVNPMTMFGPRDITLDNFGNVLVADTGGKRIRVYNAAGEWLRDIGFGGAGVGQLEEPVGLAVNPINNEIYVADTWNQRVQVFDAEGQILRVFDVPMWYDTRSSADRPYLAVSPDGRLLAVTDMSSEGRNGGPRIAIYDMAGNPALTFNAPLSDFDAGFYGLRVVGGLDFAADGSLYVLDAEDGRILRFPPPPVFSSIAPPQAAPLPSGAEADLQPFEDEPLDPEFELEEGENEGENEGESGLGQPISPAEHLPFSVDETFNPPEGE